jgi:CO/xanthine dehydrogenase Mo-binding subunit
LLAVKDLCDKNPKAGLAAALKNTGLGVGVTDTGRAIVSVEDGKVHVRTGAARIGQGLDCVALQITCQTLDIVPEMVIVEHPDSKRTPNSGTTTASRQTAFTGQAIIEACRKLKLELDNGKNIQNLEGREFFGEYTCITDPITTDKDHPYSHLAYSYGVQLVILDDKGKVSAVHAVYDIGQVINQANAEGQLHGGITMGLGYALTEDFPLEECVPQAKIGTLGLWRAEDIPKMSVQFVNSGELLDVAYGAKGVGEISAIPTAPAVAAAYYNRDGKMRSKLPLEDTAYRKRKTDGN